MQNLKVILGLATCAVSLSLANQTIAGDTQVRGTTLRATEIGIDKYDYTPLPNVRIKAYRTGPLLKYLVKSNQKGDFDFKVPSGAPFKVLFYLDNDTVPEMQNLAGKDGMFHEFHVGLYTLEQYQTLQKEEKLPPLAPKLERLLAELPLAAKEEISLIQQMLLKVR